MPSYQQLLNQYRPLFEAQNISYETLKLFLFELCSEENINLYLDKDQTVNQNILAKFNQSINLLLAHKPLAQVLGYSYFYGYKFIVNDQVLIPRYETEELVLRILMESDEYFNNQNITACDIGTGSGAIALSLLKETDNFKMIATDISKTALEVAKNNALALNVSPTFLLGDMLEPLITENIKVDLLISNPPYIPKNEEIQTSVKNCEPHVALFGDIDGLGYYRRILEKAHLILNDKWMIAFEIGYNQKNDLERLAHQYLKDFDFKCYQDLNHKDRIIIIKRRY